MKTKLYFIITLFAFFTLAFLPNSFSQLEAPFVNIPFNTANISEPVPPPAAVRDFFELDLFYQQWINVRGFPVLASAKVSPYAVKEVAYLIYQITRHSPVVLQAMVKNKVRFSIIAHNERTTEIPEHSIHPEPHFFYDMRNRGGYCPKCLTVSAPEETVLDEGWYSVTIHEFAHAFHEAGLNTIDPAFENKLRTTYNAAMERGLWQNTYSSTNRSEYWAQGVGTWFNANPDFKTVTTRTALKNYDPGLASLLTEVFGDGAWQYTLPANRTHLPHLQGFNPQAAPRLKHPPELLETYEQFTSNPDNDGGGKWVNLEPYDPSQLSSLNKSKRTEDSISIYFMNHTGATVSVYQVHPDGQEIPRRNVIYGNFTELGANIGSILLVKDDTGEKLVVFLVDESVHGFVARAFVGTPDVPLPTVQLPVVVEVPETGAWLAVQRPPGLSAANFVIKPGAFAIFAHKNQPSVSQSEDFNTYRLRSVLGAADFPNLAVFFQSGGRIELVSHPSLNPLPPNTREPEFGDVVISEIMWGLNGSNQGKQYIELYNTSAHAYTFANGDLMFRFSKASEEPLPAEIFAPPFNTNARVKVIDKVSNKDWKVPGQSGNVSQDRPLISMYRTIDYTTGSVPDGTLTSSWKASTGRVNLLPPSYGTPGAKHLPLAPVVYVGLSERPPMYWVNTDDGTLHRLIGDEVENFLPSVQNTTSLAVDVTDGKLYWTERTSNRTGKIRRANLDGTNVQLVKDLTSVPHGIALDVADGKMYLTNSWGKVQRLNLDGSNFQPNLITGLGMPKNLALDISEGKIYWTEASGRIRRANLDGSDVEDVATGLGTPMGMAVFDGTVYWTEMTGKNQGEIQRVNLDGTNTEMLLKLKSIPRGIALDPMENKLYWTNSRGKIQRANLDGSHIENLITGLVAPGDFILQIAAPLPPPTVVADERVPMDVNDDGIVNIQDLVLVASSFGQTGQNAADVNGDDIVNIQDLVLVAGAFGSGTVAAPILYLQGIEGFGALEVQHLLTQAREMSLTDPAYLRGIAVLEQLLAQFVPKETALLSNYPNPFNPETWIPYRLAKPADITLRIYAANGALVRTLALGHQPTGIYQNRSRAAYWDGKNDVGEPVASGIYFYTLTAGDFAATRKMLIMK